MEIRAELCDVNHVTIIEIWLRVYRSHCIDTDDIFTGMLVCKAFCRELPQLVKNLSVNRDIKQEDLDHLAHTYTGLTHLDIHLEYDDYSPQLDFTDLKFPALEALDMDCVNLQTINFTTENTPQLRHLSIENAREVEEFSLKLPELKTLNFQFVTVDDASGFGDALNACPKLESLQSYKLWGLCDVYDLHLPECTDLNLYRSDSLQGLRLWAPKLRNLNLQACYSLECVRLMDEAPAPKVTVNLVNANVDPETIRHLKGHPRVGRKRIHLPDSDPEAAMWGMMGGDEDELGGEEPDDEDDDDDDEDDNEADVMFGMGGMGGAGVFPFPIGRGVPMAFGMAGGGMQGFPFPPGMGGMGEGGHPGPEQLLQLLMAMGGQNIFAPDSNDDEDEDEDDDDGDDNDDGEGGGDEGSGGGCVIEQLD